MSEKTIILDVDGVLIDFVGGVRDRFNMPLTWKPTKWNLHEDIGISDVEFYNRISDEEFWSNLRTYPWADELMQNVYSRVSNVLFWTSPILSCNCHAGKACWFECQFGASVLHNLIIGSHKHLAARADVILIDDSNDNINKFACGGGQIILFPQSWNRNANIATSSESRLQHVKTRLEKLT